MENIEEFSRSISESERILSINGNRATISTLKLPRNDGYVTEMTIKYKDVNVKISYLKVPSKKEELENETIRIAESLKPVPQ